MSHNHNHSCSSEQNDHNHDHDHDHKNSSGVSDNLYVHIDLPNVRILNATDGSAAAKILKPWDKRLDETLVRLNTLFLLQVALLFV